MKLEHFLWSLPAFGVSQRPGKTGFLHGVVG